MSETETAQPSRDVWERRYRRLRFLLSEVNGHAAMSNKVRVQYLGQADELAAKAQGAAMGAVAKSLLERGIAQSFYNDDEATDMRQFIVKLGVVADLDALAELDKETGVFEEAKNALGG